MDSYQALLKVFARQRADDRLLVVRGLLRALGAASEEDEAFLTARAGAPPVPSRALTQEELDGVLTHHDERGLLGQMLAHAEPVLRKILPPPTTGQRGEKASTRAHPRLAALLARLQRALGLSLGVALVPGALGQTDLDEAGATLLVGRELLPIIDEPLVSHALARLAARARLHHALYARMAAADFGRAVAAIIATTCRSFSPPYPTEEIEWMRAKLDKQLGKRVRRQLEAISLELCDRPIDPQRWRAAMEQSEDRVALAVCGDLEAALRAVIAADGLLSLAQGGPAALAAGASARLRQLLTFAVSEEHLTLRERLGTALPSERGS
jgi:hypothetical protein